MAHKITIEFSADGESETSLEFAANENVSTVDVGLALASATRVAAIAFQKAIQETQGVNHPIEQLEAQIAECYNTDLQEGDKGESETTERVEEE